MSSWTKRESQGSIFNFRLRNKESEADADDEISNHGDPESRPGSLVLPWQRRRISSHSTSSHGSQVFYPSLNINGKLFVAIDQNGISSPGPLTPLPLPPCTMKKVKEESVSTSVILMESVHLRLSDVLLLICITCGGLGKPFTWYIFLFYIYLNHWLPLKVKRDTIAFTASIPLPLKHNDYLKATVIYSFHCHLM